MGRRASVVAYGAVMFLHYERGSTIHFEGPGSNNY
jgi:hypothetical protein